MAKSREKHAILCNAKRETIGEIRRFSNTAMLAYENNKRRAAGEEFLWAACTAEKVVHPTASGRLFGKGVKNETPSKDLTLRQDAFFTADKEEKGMNEGSHFLESTALPSPRLKDEAPVQVFKWFVVFANNAMSIIGCNEYTTKEEALEFFESIPQSHPLIFHGQKGKTKTIIEF